MDNPYGYSLLLDMKELSGLDTKYINSWMFLLETLNVVSPLQIGKQASWGCSGCE